MRGRDLSASIFFHVAILAAVMLFATRSADDQSMLIEVPLVEVSLIEETIREPADNKSDDAAPAPQSPAPQPTAAAPRPNPKPAVPARKKAPRPNPEKSSADQLNASTTKYEKFIVNEAAANAVPISAAQNKAEQSVAPGSAAGSPPGAGAPQGTGAAPNAGSGGGGGAGKGKRGPSANDYLERARQALAKHKQYPREAVKLKQEGTVRLALVLARDGTVLSARIDKGSGFPLLDEAALQMTRDASPLPRLPDDVEGDSAKIALPLTFSIGFFDKLF